VFTYGNYLTYWPIICLFDDTDDLFISIAPLQPVANTGLEVDLDYDATTRRYTKLSFDSDVTGFVFSILPYKHRAFDETTYQNKLITARRSYGADADSTLVVYWFDGCTNNDTDGYIASGSCKYNPGCYFWVTRANFGVAVAFTWDVTDGTNESDTFDDQYSTADYTFWRQFIVNTGVGPYTDHRFNIDVTSNVLSNSVMADFHMAIPLSNGFTYPIDQLLRLFVRNKLLLG
jgi:hypothetical protein